MGTNVHVSWVGLRVDIGCKDVWMDESGETPMLVVPPSLEIQAKEIVYLANCQESWVPIWDAFKDCGIRHPNHGNWVHGDKSDACNQYILDPSPYFMQWGLYVCERSLGHSGPHRCRDYEWSDDEATQVNHSYWIKASDAWERAKETS